MRSAFHFAILGIVLLACSPEDAADSGISEPNDASAGADSKAESGPSPDAGVDVVSGAVIYRRALATRATTLRRNGDPAGAVIATIPESAQMLLFGDEAAGFSAAIYRGRLGFVETSAAQVYPDTGDLPPCPTPSDPREFHLDPCSRKILPSDWSRTTSCPIVSTDATGFVGSSDPISFDAKALLPVFDSATKVALVFIRRVGGKPVYRYLSNGTEGETEQPWSSSKFLAVAGGAAHLRSASKGAVGLTAKTSTAVPLGDLVTVIETYREQTYTSNGLSRWFLNIAGRAEAQAMITSWLSRPVAETYGGNYGQAAPAIPYTFKEDSGATVTISPDDKTGLNNSLSMRTLVEAVKRLAVYDDVATRLPNVAEADLATLFYGAETSKMFQGELGGMSADLAIFLQSGLDMPRVMRESRGQYRIFSKIGYGPTTRAGVDVNDFVNVGYACLPVFDPKTGQPVPDRGAEFAIATKRSVPTTTTLANGDRALATSYAELLKKIVLPLAQKDGY